ncbi:hypothetical protein ACFQ1E_11495 [Sphingomonas canadensis]|uniref:CHRD domain-containing protein n=1 Tax=Sphingomonas canadensis TaxID=1219257 RepID=A0ABW3H6S7_9SPHN|nr:hypothetical protein [Sphingomonas canadensis]MCW3836900.1 hypothetical protein [Sphingomonas canadensis]
MLLTALALFALSPAPAPQEADPLAPAREGKLRCADPDPARKTCATITRFRMRDDGSFDATISGIADPGTTTVIVYDTWGRVEGSAVCITVRPADISGGRFFVDGKPATSSQSSELGERLANLIAPLAGKKRCFIDQEDDGAIISNVTLDGVVQIEQRRRVAWINAADGYALAGG